jgi:AcrR family transcriptional regulator
MTSMSESAHPHSPRWRRLPGERPRQILDAALEVFGEHGLAAARLEDIARTAGVSKGTIYLYFPNKEALFCEMIREIPARHIATVEGMISDTESAHEQLRQYFRNSWDYVRTPTFEILYRLILSELHHLPALYEQFIEEVSMRSMRIVAGIVRRGIANGEFREIDPLAAGRMLHSVLFTHGVWAAKRARIPFMRDLSDNQVLDQLVDFCLHAISQLPTPATPSVHT